MPPLDDRLPPTLAADPWEREVRELLQEMDREVETVVVEGKRDRAALRAGGVETEIAVCGHAHDLDGFVKTLSGETIAILTDFDEHGRGLNGRFRDHLPDGRVAVRYRRELGLLLTQRGRYDIESLNNVFSNNRRL